MIVLKSKAVFFTKSHSLKKWKKNFVEPTIPIGPCDAVTFVALIDGQGLSQQSNLCVMAVTFENQIIITATDTDEEIQLRIPINVTEGSVVLPEENYNASYTNLTTQETREAVNGSIFVLSHNTLDNSLTGTFRFNTGMEEISAGGFNIVYQ